MSNSLYWLPPPDERKEHCIYSLKKALAKRLNAEYDGSISENLGIVGKELIPFLDGIVEGNDNKDMGRDAKSLIAAIEKFGEVELIIHS